MVIAWLFRITFVLAGVALICWLADTVRNLLTPMRRQTAVVERREREEMPGSLAFHRQRKTEYRIFFRLTENETLCNMQVREDVYHALASGDTGTLSYQGSWFLSFKTADGRVIRHGVEQTASFCGEPAEDAVPENEDNIE